MERENFWGAEILTSDIVAIEIPAGGALSIQCAIRKKKKQVLTELPSQKVIITQAADQNSSCHQIH